MASDLIEKLIRPEIQAMQAYHIPPSQGMVKLDSMENPYIFPDELRNQWLQKIKSVNFNRYPDPTASQVRSLVMKQLHLTKPRAVMFGNGSDELIQIVIQSMSADSGADNVCYPDFCDVFGFLDHYR